MISPSRLRAAIKALLIHLGLSSLVAMLVAVVVFGIWFKFPFRSLAGGQHLFWILVGADVVCGPLITAVLFSPQKSRAELRLDLTLVAIIQLAALGYGLQTIAQARPVVLAFEVDRFVAVSAAEVDHQAMQPTQKLSWSGPILVGTRSPKDGDETLRSIEMSMQGKEPSVRPDWWQPYDASKPQVKRRMKRLDDLRSAQSPRDRAIIDASSQDVGLPIEKISYLPLTAAKSNDNWTILLNPEADIVGFLPIDGF